MLRHRFAISLSGFIWMGIGIFLLHKGLQYFSAVGPQIFNKTYEGFSLILLLGSIAGTPEKGVMILLCIGIALGFFKGRIILKKSVNRIVSRIRSMPSPISIKQLYPKEYYFLIGGMMLLGFVFKFLPLPLDVKGFIDFTIGIALINGAMLYFRAAFVPEKAHL